MTPLTFEESIQGFSELEGPKGATLVGFLPPVVDENGRPVDPEAQLRWNPAQWVLPEILASMRTQARSEKGG